MDAEPVKFDPFRLLIIVPLFCGYYYGSFSGLRMWIAVQKVPAVVLPEANIEDPTAKSRKMKISIFTFVTTLTSLIVVGAAAKTGLRGGLDILNFVIVAIMFFAAITMVCIDWFGTRIVIHRNVKGALIGLPKVAELSRLRRISMVTTTSILAVGLPIGAFWLRSDICASLMAFVALFVIQGQKLAKTNSLRKLIITAILTEVGIILYLAAFAALSIYASNDKVEVEEPATSFDVDRTNRINQMYVIGFATLLSTIIATCLRFDYSNHVATVEAAGSHAPLISLEVVPTPEAKTPEKQLTAGVVAPSRLAVAFARPYFTSALAAWILTNVAVTQLILAGFLPEFGHVVYALYLHLCSTPVIVLTIVGVAVARGEAKHMWKYEEVWTSEPTVQQAVIEGLEEVDEKAKILVDVSEESVLLV